MKIIDHFEDKNYIYIVMERLYGSDLCDLLKVRKFTITETRDLMAQIFNALEYLHTKCSIAHGDVKLDNLMMTSCEGNQVKLVDFGSATKLNHKGEASWLSGSVGYFAPELYLNKPYTANCDMWSAGVVMFTLFCGHLPFVQD